MPKKKESVEPLNCIKLWNSTSFRVSHEKPLSGWVPGAFHCCCPSSSCDEEIAKESAFSVLACVIDELCPFGRVRGQREMKFTCICVVDEAAALKKPY
jgi:hypothetical protein